ncbi:MAG: creatininase family protein [Thermoproteota archaeon]|nr:MAG: creatininase family protein [Candidatus Korarchaeota archaeon]
MVVEGLRWWEKSWRQLEDALEECDVAILPVGSVEQHGPALPVGADYLASWRIAEAVAERAGVPALAPVPYGVSAHHKDFPGTVYVSPEAFKAYLRDVLYSLWEQGVRKLLVVNGHGGNSAVLRELALEARIELSMTVLVAEWWHVSAELSLFKPEERHHAGAEESSLMMHLAPELVDESLIVDGPLPEAAPVSEVKTTGEVTKTGVIGLAKTASREKGERVFELVVSKLAEVVEKMKRGELGLP